MIFYFSGTGNSEWVAKQIAAGIGDTAVNIADNTVNKIRHIDTGENTGIVFPVYAWGVPGPVARFAGSLKTAEGAYRFAVCTCGDEAGNAMEIFSRIFPSDGVWSVIMPNNYVRFYDLDAPSLITDKIGKAKQKIEQICESVRSKEKIREVHKGTFPYIKSYVVNPIFRSIANRAGGFTSEESCTSCGLCNAVCPMGNISLKNGRPEWGRNCIQCMSCINRCPAEAILCGAASKNRGRYTFEKWNDPS